MSNHIYRAVATIQRSGVVLKGNKNDLLKSKYADYADVRAFLDPQLAAHGLVLSFQPGALRDVVGKLVQSMALTVVHIESMEAVTFAGEVPLPKENQGTSATQMFGSALTYGFRYMLVAFFGLVVGDDNDAQRARSMMGAGGRDALPAVSGDRWDVLMVDEAWKAYEAPDGTGDPLGELGNKQLGALFKEHPTVPALCAWCALIVEEMMQRRGLDWTGFTERAGGQWPDKLTGCTGEQLAAAVRALKSIPV